MRFFSWWRRRRPRLHPIGEAEAYARSYGDRSEEVVSIERAPPAPRAVQEVPGRLTDAKLRGAFLARLASRSGRNT
ncbi:MAG: hypothetical protein V7644_2700 [Actinomycetota bacterium]|jgi:hypothetical protein